MIFSPQTKKNLLAVVFVIGVISIAFLLYYVFFRGAAPVPPTNTNNAPINGLPKVNGANGNTNQPIVNGRTNIPPIDTVANGGLTVGTSITPDNAASVAPALDASSNLRYYNPNDGKFYRVAPDGTVELMNDAIFRGVETVAWAQTSDEAILEFPDGANIYYDFDTGRQVTLPKEYTEFDFSPRADQIAFKYMHIDPERRVLGVANPDGSNARAVEDLGYNADRVNVDWSPTGNIAATWSEFIGLDRQELGFIGLQGENFKGTIVEGRGLEQQYSPDGKQLLYSVYSQASDYNPGLWIVDADGDSIGGHRRELGVVTSADKCSFDSSGNFVYCGVPANPADGFGLSDDFLRGTTDEIVRIDLRSGVTNRIAIPTDAQGNSTAVIDSIVVAEDGKSLYYHDKNTGALIKIQLSY